MGSRWWPTGWHHQLLKRQLENYLCPGQSDLLHMKLEYSLEV